MIRSALMGSQIPMTWALDTFERQSDCADRWGQRHGAEKRDARCVNLRLAIWFVRIKWEGVTASHSLPLNL